MVLGKDSLWQVPSGLVDEAFYCAWGLSHHLPTGLWVDGRQWCTGTWPRISSWGQGIWMLDMIAQQGCGGEKGLALGGTQLLLSAGVGWEGAFVTWNGERTGGG